MSSKRLLTGRGSQVLALFSELGDEQLQPRVQRRTESREHGFDWLKEARRAFLALVASWVAHRGEITYRESAGPEPSRRLQQCPRRSRDFPARSHRRFQRIPSTF